MPDEGGGEYVHVGVFEAPDGILAALHNPQKKFSTGQQFRMGCFFRGGDAASTAGMESSASKFKVLLEPITALPRNTLECSIAEADAKTSTTSSHMRQEGR